MGNYQPSGVSQNYNYFGITFFFGDKLRLIGAPSEIMNETESLIRSFWEIQDVYKVDGYIEFKLKGMPLLVHASILDTTDSSVKFKFLLCTLIKLYYRKGWHIKSTPVLQRYGTHGSTVIFEKDEPIETSVICLNLRGTDTIRFLGPDYMIAQFRSTIQTYWHKGIQRESRLSECWEFKLNGNPFSFTFFNDYESSVAPVLLLEIFKMFDKSSWTYCGLIYSGDNNQGIYFRNSNSIESSANSFSYAQQPPPSYSSVTSEKIMVEHSEFFAIELRKNDLIRLVRPLPQIIELVRNTINQTWPYGIQDQKAVNQVIYEFKLKGNPWSATSEESVLCRRLFNRLLGNLIENNCDLTITCSTSERISTFFFKYKLNNPIINPNVQSNKIFSLSLNLFDKIRIINGEDTHTLTDIIRSGINQGWPKGIQEENVYVNSYEFKMRGNPFNPTSSDSIDVCVLYMHLLNSLKYQKNISLYCTADISNKIYTESSGNSSRTFYTDIHTIFFAFN